MFSFLNMYLKQGLRQKSAAQLGQIMYLETIYGKNGSRVLVHVGSQRTDKSQWTAAEALKSHRELRGSIEEWHREAESWWFVSCEDRRKLERTRSGRGSHLQRTLSISSHLSSSFFFLLKHPRPHLPHLFALWGVRRAGHWPPLCSFPRLPSHPRIVKR